MAPQELIEMSSTTTSTESKALALLGYGASAEHTAAACGVEPSRITQMLANEDFALKVSELRFVNLSKHNERDSKYDTLEDELVAKLDLMKDLICNPMQLLKALQTINSLKRRGATAPEMLGTNQQVVTLTMPITVIQKFSTNINNQVIQAGDQELVTIQSAVLLDQVKKAMKESIQNGSQRATADTGFGGLRAIEAVSI